VLDSQFKNKPIHIDGLVIVIIIAIIFIIIIIIIIIKNNNNNMVIADAASIYNTTPSPLKSFHVAFSKYSLKI